MKLYNILNDVPVSNWNKIQRSFISETPDLTPLILTPKNNSSNFTKRRYERLIKKIKTSKKYNKKLYEKYLEFMYQLKDVDINLNKLYTTLKLKLIEFNLIIEKNAYRKLKGWNKLENPNYPINKIFNQYLTELNKNYTDFEFRFNYIIENYAEEWKRIFKTDIPKELEDKFKNGFGFFLWEEYLFEINTWSKELMFIASTKRFQELFIKQKTIKVQDLEEVNKRLLKDFKDNKQFQKWFAIRFDFFDMKKIKFKAEKESTILNEVLSLSKITELNIDIDKVTIGDLTTYRELADNIIEANKPKK